MKKNIGAIIMLLSLFIIYKTNIFTYTYNNVKQVIPIINIDEDKDIPISVIDINSYVKEYQNTDIKAYLEIKNTDISTPVVQTTDNDYYLKHNINKNNDSAGAIFLDYRVEPNDRKVLIYGHNSKLVPTTFKELENYYNEEYYNENKIIELTSNNSVNTYELFSVYIEPENWSYMNLNFTDEGWLEHLLMFKNKSWYQSDITLTKDDEIIIIQTCSYHKDYNKYKNKYLLLIGKKINSINF